MGLHLGRGDTPQFTLSLLVVLSSILADFVFAVLSFFLSGDLIS